MNSSDLYRAVPSVSRSLSSNDLEGGLCRLDTEFKSFDLASMMKSPPHNTNAKSGCKTSPASSAASSSVLNCSLERFLERFAQPYHAQLEGSCASLLEIVSHILLEMGVTIVKMNSAKGKISCSSNGQRFNIKITNVAGQNSAVLEMIVLSVGEDLRNNWGECLEKVCEHEMLRPHVVKYVKVANQSLLPLFAVQI